MLINFFWDLFLFRVSFQPFLFWINHLSKSFAPLWQAHYIWIFWGICPYRTFKKNSRPHHKSSSILFWKVTFEIFVYNYYRNDSYTILENRYHFHNNLIRSNTWLVLCLHWCSFPNMETWMITVFEFKRGAGDPNCYTGVFDWRHHPHLPNRLSVCQTF